MGWVAVVAKVSIRFKACEVQETNRIFLPFRFFSSSRSK